MTKKVLNFLNFFVSLSVILSLVWFHGFAHRPGLLYGHMVYLFACLGFFLIRNVILGMLSESFGEYLKKNLLELILHLVLFVITIWQDLTQFSLWEIFTDSPGAGKENQGYILFLHIWLLLIVGVEMGKNIGNRTIWRVPPRILFILSFFTIIFAGSSLLMLPEMTTLPGGMKVMDAVFTSISANCVTGLTVIDISSALTLKGQVLILLLIQIGGLNIIFFATFFISSYHKVVTTGTDDLTIKELMSVSSLGGEDLRILLRRVVLTAFIIEGLGALVLYFQWGPEVTFHDNWEKIFYSVFHSVSAFNNAGFSLFSQGFTDELVVNNLSFHITIAFLIILGGIGFAVIWDLPGVRRILEPEKGRRVWNLDTKVSVISAAVLIVVGMGLFWAFEYNRSLAGQSALQAGVSSFFQSVTTRTAGFNTVDIGSVGIPGIILMVIWMFIGAGSGSTGGGIKTSTFSVLVLSVVEKLRKKKFNTSEKLRESPMVQKAMTIFGVSFVVIGLSFLGLVFLEPNLSAWDLLFEEVSAFGTVGLSTGITGELSEVSKIIIMVSMFIGRVGPLALAWSLLRVKSMQKKLLTDGVLIG